MSKLWVKVNYTAMASLVKVLESSVKVLKEHFDKGAAEPFKVCNRPDCPNRTEESVDGDNVDKRVASIR
jgi:hypothetical protein